MNPHPTCPRPSLFRDVRALAHRPARERSGLHFIEGVRPFLRALDSGIPLEAILFSEILNTNDFVAKRVRLAKRAGVRVERLSPEEFRSVSVAERASGVAAVARQHWSPLAEVNPGEGLCWLAMGLIRAAGNLGTILRTAEAAGAAGAIFLGPETDPFAPDAVRASMGGVFGLRLVRTSVAAFAGWARARGCRVVGTSPAAALSYLDVPVDPPVVVMFGEERAGLSADESAACTHMACIPVAGRADSLNVGVAAGVMLYEVMRRRSQGAMTAADGSKG